MKEMVFDVNMLVIRYCDGSIVVTEDSCGSLRGGMNVINVIGRVSLR